MADDGRAQAPGITGGNAAGEEHPSVCAFSGARDFQCGRHSELVAGLHERSRVIPPFRLVEIDGQEVATVVLQQWIDANRVIAGQMLVDHRVRQRDQKAIATVRALDARLFADTGTPLVGAGRRVA